MSGQSPMSEKPPPGWGDDPLTRFLEDAYKNRWASFANKPSALKLLVRIDGCYATVLADWANPRPALAAMLAYRSHAAFRASCEHALAGQAADVWPSLRACLEFSAYCLHLAKNPDLSEIWLGRHDDDDAMGALLKAFTAAKIKATVKASDRKIEAVYAHLYQRAIDFGAHPNERSVTSSLRIIEGAGKTEYVQSYLVGDGLALEHGLKSVAQAGVCALNILHVAYPARFAEVGMPDEPFALREGL